MKIYNGRVPACGVFCGGCPTYTRQKNPCLGAQLNSARCENKGHTILSRIQNNIFNKAALI